MTKFSDMTWSDRIYRLTAVALSVASGVVFSELLIPRHPSHDATDGSDSAEANYQDKKGLVIEVGVLIGVVTAAAFYWFHSYLSSKGVFQKVASSQEEQGLLGLSERANSPRKNSCCFGLFSRASGPQKVLDSSLPDLTSTV